MRRIAVVVLGTIAFLAGVTAPANADDMDGPDTWDWHSPIHTTVQVGSGLLNVASGGNLCASLAGVLAPATNCPTG